MFTIWLVYFGILLGFPSIFLIIPTLIVVWKYRETLYRYDPNFADSLGWFVICAILMALCGMSLILKTDIDHQGILETLVPDLLLSCFIGPIVEEMTMRLWLMPRLIAQFKIPFWVANVLSSMVFAVPHHPDMRFTALLMGVILGCSVALTGRMIYPILLHVLTNIGAVCFYYWLGT